PFPRCLNRQRRADLNAFCAAPCSARVASAAQHERRAAIGSSSLEGSVPAFERDDGQQRPARRSHSGALLSSCAHASSSRVPSLNQGVLPLNAFSPHMALRVNHFIAACATLARVVLHVELHAPGANEVSLVVRRATKGCLQIAVYQCRLFALRAIMPSTS